MGCAHPSGSIPQLSSGIRFAPSRVVFRSLFFGGTVQSCLTPFFALLGLPPARVLVLLRLPDFPPFIVVVLSAAPALERSEGKDLHLMLVVVLSVAPALERSEGTDLHLKDLSDRCAPQYCATCPG